MGYNQHFDIYKIKIPDIKQALQSSFQPHIGEKESTKQFKIEHLVVDEKNELIFVGTKRALLMYKLHGIQKEPQEAKQQVPGRTTFVNNEERFSPNSNKESKKSSTDGNNEEDDEEETESEEALNYTLRTSGESLRTEPLSSISELRMTQAGENLDHLLNYHMDFVDCFVFNKKQKKKDWVNVKFFENRITHVELIPGQRVLLVLFRGHIHCMGYKLNDNLNMMKRITINRTAGDLGSNRPLQYLGILEHESLRMVSLFTINKDNPNRLLTIVNGRSIQEKGSTIIKQFQVNYGEYSVENPNVLDIKIEKTRATHIIPFSPNSIYQLIYYQHFILFSSHRDYHILSAETGEKLNPSHLINQYGWDRRYDDKKHFSSLCGIIGTDESIFDEVKQNVPNWTNPGRILAISYLYPYLICAQNHRIQFFHTYFGKLIEETTIRNIKATSLMTTTQDMFYAIAFVSDLSKPRSSGFPSIRFSTFSGSSSMMAHHGNQYLLVGKMKSMREQKIALIKHSPHQPVPWKEVLQLNEYDYTLRMQREVHPKDHIGLELMKYHKMIEIQSLQCEAAHMMMCHEPHYTITSMKGHYQSIFAFFLKSNVHVGIIINLYFPMITGMDIYRELKHVYKPKPAIHEIPDDYHTNIFELIDRERQAFCEVFVDYLKNVQLFLQNDKSIDQHIQRCEYYSSTLEWRSPEQITWMSLLHHFKEKKASVREQMHMSSNAIVLCSCFPIIPNERPYKIWSRCCDLVSNGSLPCDSYLLTHVSTIRAKMESFPVEHSLRKQLAHALDILVLPILFVKAQLQPNVEQICMEISEIMRLQKNMAFHFDHHHLHLTDRLLLLLGKLPSEKPLQVNCYIRQHVYESVSFYKKPRLLTRPSYKPLLALLAKHILPMLHQPLIHEIPKYEQLSYVERYALILRRCQLMVEMFIQFFNRSEGQLPIVDVFDFVDGHLIDMFNPNFGDREFQSINMPLWIKIEYCYQLVRDFPRVWTKPLYQGNYLLPYCCQLLIEVLSLYPSHDTARAQFHDLLNLREAWVHVPQQQLEKVITYLDRFASHESLTKERQLCIAIAGDHERNLTHILVNHSHDEALENALEYCRSSRPSYGNDWINHTDKRAFDILKISYPKDKHIKQRHHQQHLLQLLIRVLQDLRLKCETRTDFHHYHEWVLDIVENHLEPMYLLSVIDLLPNDLPLHIFVKAFRCCMATSRRTSMTLALDYAELIRLRASRVVLYRQSVCIHRDTKCQLCHDSIQGPVVIYPQSNRANPQPFHATCCAKIPLHQHPLTLRDYRLTPVPPHVMLQDFLIRSKP